MHAVSFIDFTFTDGADEQSVDPLSPSGSEAEPEGDETWDPSSSGVNMKREGSNDIEFG